ncbi:class I SAM-dependent DNA methyltransferase [Kutzneria sp. NPDC052558]|uniref:class I SAM-dependent DNA methyltransferase n=1 Tax=Kutzneria sp. NPDC052558 TaxID=3364121 RepID=UPI0037CAC38E
MKAPYDDYANEYLQATDSDFRRDVIDYSVHEAVGDVRGLAVLDLGCGDGRVGRLLVDRGAGRVVGVDQSEEMLLLAETHAGDRDRLTYLRHHAHELPDLGGFDLVVAVNMLHYARTEDELARIYQRAAAHLPPGGRFIAVLNDAHYDPDGPSIARYGFVIHQLGGPRHNGSELHQQFVDGDRVVVEVRNYHWLRETHENLLQKAGFAHIEWTPLTASPDSAARCGDGYYDGYLANPHLTMLRATLR